MNSVIPREGPIVKVMGKILVYEWALIGVYVDRVRTLWSQRN